MFGRHRPEVLIVGAGPVGLFAALRLSRRGVRVQVLDKQYRLGAHSYALALHARTLDLLAEEGLAQHLKQRAHEIRRILVLEREEERAAAHLDTMEEGAIVVLQQDELEDLLLSALKQEGVEVLWSHEASVIEPEEEKVAVQIDRLEEESVGYGVAHREWIVSKTTSLDVPFVIGADGHRSDVRKALGVDFDRVGETQHFAFFEFRTHAQLEHVMRLIVHDRQTDVLWPLPDGFCRWGFEVEPTEALEMSPTGDRLTLAEEAGRFPVLGRDHLMELLAERAPWFSASVEDVRWRRLVRFEHRLASSFGRGRIWLAGDAGHLAGPIGVQSMNVGIQEAAQLVDGIVDVLQKNAGLDSLATYDRQRREHWKTYFDLPARVRANDEADPWIKEHGEQIVACVPASGAQLESILAQLGLGLPAQSAL